MDNKDKVKMFEMRLEGYTLDEVGEKFGITRERVRQILTSTATRGAAIKRGSKDMMYPNISKWLRDNDVSIGELNVLMGHTQSNSGTTKLSRLLHNTAKLGIRLEDIRKILNITGMTFEEAFNEEDNND